MSLSAIVHLSRDGCSNIKGNRFCTGKGAIGGAALLPEGTGAGLAAGRKVQRQGGAQKEENGGKHSSYTEAA